MADVNFNNLYEELAGNKIFNEILKGADDKAAKELTILLTVLQRHGITKLESFNILVELAILLRGAEE